MAKKEVYVGADHAGFEMKEKMKKWLLEKGWKIEDIGAVNYDKNDDYPTFAERVGKGVVKNKGIGILFCGSAEGMCIAANKIKGVRAVAVFSDNVAKMSREHLDANILCLSGWWLEEDGARRIIDTWLNTKFSGEERHVRRIEMIKNLENGR